MTTQNQRNENKRQAVLQEIINSLESQGETVLKIKSNEITFPTVDEENNDIWIKIVVSVPRGAKDEEFDGYNENQYYEMKEREKKEKQEQLKKAKEKKMARDKKLREKKKQQEEQKNQ